MAYTKKLTRQGNSLAVVLNRPLLEMVGLGPDSEVEIQVKGKTLVIKPARKPKPPSIPLGDLAQAG